MGNDVTYQWYVSTSSSSGPWTPTGTSTASLSATVTQDSWFYCAVTCPEGPSTGNSNVLHVEVVPVVLVPFTGSNTNACGTNIALQDHAGSGNYSNNANGYTVLEAGTNATITISGTYWGEGCCDDLYIYSGAGTGGAVLLNPIGNGAGGVSVNYTGAPGQTLTVRFTSDLSIVYAGFDLMVTYTNPCVPPCIPVATASLDEDCGNSQFYVDVEVTDLNGAPSVSINSDYSGDPGAVSAVGVGSYSIGPFASTSTVNITVTNDGGGPGCETVLGPYTMDCALLGKNAGVELKHAAYRGTQPAMLDLLGGNISAVSGPIGDITQHLSTGKVRILGVSGTKRSRFAPNVPTFE
ncbi:MAG TPA: tripartite tricarboxylate transporter substrate-binding protein, partial [Flavobacteriales bacterium]|nr:tripartite tricarboxylate transporter substrate-binding protein [Flavobacteriales bacterium]